MHDGELGPFPASGIGINAVTDLRHQLAIRRKQRLNLSWRRRWQRARQIWRIALLDLVACGESFWWVGAIFTAAYLILFVGAIWHVLTENGPAALGLADWIVMLIIPCVIFLLGAKVWGKIRLALGFSALRQRRLAYLRGLRWSQNRALAMVWVMNILGAIIVPVLTLGLILQFLKWISAHLGLQAVQ